MMRTLCVLLAVVAGVAVTSAERQFVWRDRDGAPLPESDFRKSRNGFGAFLVLTEDAGIFERWNTPEEPRIVDTNTATRGVPLHTVLIYVGARAGEDGRANVTYQATVKKPDGSLYGEFKDIPVWKDAPGPITRLQLCNAALGITIEPEDPAGEYVVEVVITDHIANTALKLTQKFVVEE